MNVTLNFSKKELLVLWGIIIAMFIVTITFSILFKPLLVVKTLDFWAAAKSIVFSIMLMLTISYFLAGIGITIYFVVCSICYLKVSKALSDKCPTTIKSKDENLNCCFKTQGMLTLDDREGPVIISYYTNNGDYLGEVSANYIYVVNHFVL